MLDDAEIGGLGAAALLGSHFAEGFVEQFGGVAAWMSRRGQSRDQRFVARKVRHQPQFDLTVSAESSMLVEG